MYRFLQIVAVLYICAHVALSADQKCVCKSTVCDCSNSNRTTIPNEKELANDTTSLDLSGNLLTKLDANGFARFTNLSTLWLGMNQITTVHKDAFANCTKLTSLCLGMNAIAHLVKATFTNVPLANLTLAWNNFSAIPDAALEPLTALKKLDLSFLNNNSDIANISIDPLPKTITAMKSLEEFSLAGLGYKNFSMKYLAEASDALLMVDLSHNKIVHVSGGGGSALKLERLVVSHNLMTDLTADIFSGMDNIKELDASYNKLKTIKGGPFSMMKKLENLTLSGNLLSSLASDAFKGLGEMTGLDLSHNKFMAIPKSICTDAKKLKRLNMDGFAGHSLASDALTSCKATLEVFSMRSSEILDFGMAFANLTALKDLDLSDNAKLKLNNKNAFQFATALATLNLSAMATKMSSNFYSLPPAITVVPKLTTLDISHGRFASFNKNDTEFFQKLTSLHATHNPYDCACKHLDFIIWYQNESNSVIALDDRHAYNCSTCDYQCGPLPTPLTTFTPTHCDTTGGENHARLVKYAVGMCMVGLVVGVLLTSLVVFGLNKKRAMCFKGPNPYESMDRSTNA